MPYDILLGRNESDKKEFGNRGIIYIGRGFVKMGQYTSLSNKIFLDVARTHIILVAGKRGCLTENTLVFTDKGYKQIKDFDEKKDKVFSFNKETKTFELENAELLKYPIENEDLFKIKFENGKELNLTKEHPLLVANGNKLLTLLWREAKDLNEGDKILSIGKSFEDLVPLEIKK